MERDDAAARELSARRGGAKALLLTILGEFVLPSGGAVWTSSLIAGADALGITEKNARQALARIGDQGTICGTRHGRSVRWELTDSGRALLESGADRIYDFGASNVDWQGAWLVAHCPVAEQHRGVRAQLRTQLGFLGFGELSASLLISPHVEREAQLRQVLERLDLQAECTVLRSTTGSDEEDARLIEKAWDLSELAASYDAFTRTYDECKPASPAASFRAVAELVHDWRRFPFTDPELPTQLLPQPWAGHAAARVFHRHRGAWSPAAQQWFADREVESS